MGQENMVTSIPVVIAKDQMIVPTKIIDLASIDISAIATVWTPASGKKFRLMGGQFSVSSNCSVLFEDNTHAGAPTVGGRTPMLSANTPYIFDWYNGVLSAAAGNLLKAT